MLRVTRLIRAAEVSGAAPPVTGAALLLHDQRHVRRRALPLTDGQKVLVDFAEPTVLGAGDILVLEGGGAVEIRAAQEPLYEVLPRDGLHLVALAWHIGNRHLPAALEEGRILILRDHVIRAMLEGLGARVNEISAPFSPLRGAYDGAGAGAGHAHGHHHGLDESHHHGPDGSHHHHDHHHDHGRHHGGHTHD